MFPDFLVIGAQKAGTTWLHRNLKAHPQIWTPREKELHYFDEKIRQEGGLWTRLRGDRVPDVRWRRQLMSRFKRFPKDWSLPGVAWDLRFFFRRPSDDWYASLFEAGESKVTGETTPDYSILEKETIAHVYELMPEARIIFMMRNPLERLWSSMDMRLRIEEGFFAGVKERKRYRYFSRGRRRLLTDYLRTLDNWSSYYPEEQIFVGFLEDVHFFPEEVLKDLYRFLGVDASVKPHSLRGKVHSSSQSTMSTEFAVLLTHFYHEELKALAERFGGYASFWLHCAERFINDPPEEDAIPYPLWESAMWEEWEGSRAFAMQSGSLSSLQTSL